MPMKYLILACVNFSPNNLKSKNHLTEHVLQPKESVEHKHKSKKESREIITEAVNWRDLYDDDGNPLYDTTNSDSSSD